MAKQSKKQYARVARKRNSALAWKAADASLLSGLSEKKAIDNMAILNKLDGKDDNHLHLIKK